MATTAKWQKQKAKLIQRFQENPRAWSEHVLRYIRWRCKRTGMECTIEPEDIPLPKYCPALGIELIYGEGGNAPSVDRINNKKGYVPGNVRVISKRANKIKNDATLDELLKVFKYVERETTHQHLDTYWNKK